MPLKKQFNRIDKDGNILGPEDSSDIDIDAKFGIKPKTDEDLKIDEYAKQHQGFSKKDLDITPKKFGLNDRNPKAINDTRLNTSESNIKKTGFRIILAIIGLIVVALISISVIKHQSIPETFNSWTSVFMKNKVPEYKPRTDQKAYSFK